MFKAKLLALILGGALGTLSRYTVVTIVTSVTGGRFPFGTMVVNLTGCFLVGLLAMVSDTRLFLGQNVRVFLIVGFCGAFTTFSAFILENAALMKDGENLKAFMNMAASLIFGFVALKLGLMLGQRVM